MCKINPQIKNQIKLKREQNEQQKPNNYKINPQIKKSCTREQNGGTTVRQGMSRDNNNYKTQNQIKTLTPNQQQWRMD